MAVADRHIHQLRLHGPSAAAINRGATLLEDALRTASMPSMPGRVLLIRSLPLGAIDLHSSSTRLALLIEQRMREVMRGAVHIAAPDAPRANAVYYHDEPEALLLLAQRIASGQALSAWYWPRILPGWEPKQPASRALPQLFEAVIRRLPQASAHERAAVLHWLTTLHEQNLLNPVLRSLTPADGDRLLQIFRWTMPSAQIPPASTPVAPIPPRRIQKLARWQPALRHWAREWDAADPRTVWLAMVAIEQIAPMLPPALVAIRAQAFIRWAQAVDTLIEQVQESASSPVQAKHPRTESEMPPEAFPTESDVLEQASLSEEVVPGTAYATTFGGLFYCIRILEYLGIANALDDQPEWIEQQLVGHIFRAIATRLALPLTDPALKILTEDLGALPFAMQAYTVPDNWHDLTEGSARVVTNGDWSILYDAGDLPLAVWSGERSDEAFGAPTETIYDEAINLPSLPAAWSIAVERWCLRFLDMPLSTLIERSAQVVATRTHLDIVFQHEQVEIAVRRAGLDFDPGWIGWLGKVVKFYYEYGL